MKDINVKGTCEISCPSISNMESFLCENPIVLQDAAKFGFKSWVIPITILILSLTGTQAAWRREKKFHAKLCANRSFPGGHRLKFPWTGLIISIVAFASFSCLILQDRATKLHALQIGEYRTYEGHISAIYRVDKGRYSWANSRVGFNITGHAIDAEGRRHKLNRYSDRVTTKRSIVADWGHNCSGYKCDLSTGDKVRIKDMSVKPLSGWDTLSIEKCDNQSG